MVCLVAVKSSITESTVANARTLMGADLSVSTRRKFSDSEIDDIKKQLPSDSRVSREWDFFTMIETGGHTRLVRVDAIDDTAPLIGTFRRDPDQARLASAGAWASPEFLDEFNVQVGSQLSMDGMPFRILAKVVEDPRGSTDFGSFAPRLYVSLEDLQRKNWVGATSTLTDTLLVVIPDVERANDIRLQLETAFRDPSIHIRTAQMSARDSIRAFQYLADYLGLVALAGFLLAAIGCAFLIHHFLQSRRFEIAVLNAFGLPKSVAMTAYFTQVLFLATAAASGALLTASILGPLLLWVIQPFAGSKLHFSLSVWNVVEAIGMTWLVAFAVGIPLLLRLKDVETKRLLAEDVSIETDFSWRRIDGLRFIPALVILFALSILVSHSWKVGSIFFGSVAVSFCLMLALNSFLFSTLSRVRNASAAPTFALWQVSRKPFSALVLLTTLTFSIVLIDMIPQIQSALREDLSVPTSNPVPSLFLFDIQDEQVSTLREVLLKKKINLQRLSPMIRARILKVNDTNFERTDESAVTSREEENDRRFRNRGVNLSYGESGSEILEGDPITNRIGPIAQISVEKGYAKRMNLKLHDRLVFDIQGLEVSAEIVNLRKVKWTSFQPNFFIIMQQDFLDEAPKTWIASLPAMDRLETRNIQDELIRQFPNISMVDINRAVGLILRFTKQISDALLFIAAFVLGCGLIVLISISRQQLDGRLKDFALLKMLGAPDGLVFRASLWEAVGLSTIASIEAIAISFSISWILVSNVFEENFRWDVAWSVSVIAGFMSVTVALLLIFSHGLRRRRPLDVWRESSYLHP